MKIEAHEEVWGDFHKTLEIKMRVLRATLHDNALEYSVLLQEELDRFRHNQTAV